MGRSEKGRATRGLSFCNGVAHNQEMKGRLIVFEGIDGAGKATQAKLLAKAIQKKGRVVSVLDFPRYSTPVGKLIRQYLKGDALVSPHVIASLFAIDRGLAAPSIRAALKKGDVICNRYTPSSVAFQTATLSNEDQKMFTRFIENLEYREFKIPKPDLVILLDIPVSRAQMHIWKKDKDRNERNLVLQNKVANRYTELARQRNWRKVRADGDERAVHARVWDAVQDA